MQIIYSVFVHIKKHPNSTLYGCFKVFDIVDQ